jgi:hypothetical protein
VRIPLDYYRILGLPIQATNEQLRQAHRDRTLQLPRREYSDAAIEGRKQLIDEAYAILSDPAQRQHYDTGFLAKTYEFSHEAVGLGREMGRDTFGRESLERESRGRESLGHGTDTRHPDVPYQDPNLIDSHTPSIEIEEDEFIGALLILQELGEYELVLKLGRPFLTGGSASLRDRHYGDPNIVFSDIVLTVALACLELGREQWQQRQYENAAEALETGQNLLLREGLFVGVRGEIQSDLHRLRPYRILELLANSESGEGRQCGLALLEEMLQERGGIDGLNSDQSGLSIDDFLRFIQQLRGYMTAEEQQALFEQEASRPSAVATYLSVYVLLARGFAECQPSLIYQAKQYLSRLSGRQDVNLERAISALLLGQTEEASRMLSLSQEQDCLDFIQQHSDQSPDLLPGLCLYTESWFQDEVFPHFRDLSKCQASLKDYFADQQVQAYLENLPDESVEKPIQSRPVSIHSRSRRDLASVSPISVAPPVYPGEPAPSPALIPDDAQFLTTTSRDNNAGWERETDHDALIAAAKARIASRTVGAAMAGSEGRLSGEVFIAERLGQSEAGDVPNAQSSVPVNRPHADPAQTEEEEVNAEMSGFRRSGRDRPSRSRSSEGVPSWLIPISALLTVILLGLLAVWAIRGLQSSQPVAQQDSEKPLVFLDTPLLALSEDEASDPTGIAILDKASAKEIVQFWLSVKGKAMGAKHEIAALEQILLDPKLSEWRTSAEKDKQDGLHRTYQHDVKIDSVELLQSSTGQLVTIPLTDSKTSTDQPTTQSSPTTSPTSQPSGSSQPSPQGSPETSSASSNGSSNSSSSSPISSGTPLPAVSPTAEADQAKVTAVVTETIQTHRGDKTDGAAQTEELRILYNLIRKDGKWKIQNWQLQ